MKAPPFSLPISRFKSSKYILHNVRSLVKIINPTYGLLSSNSTERAKKECFRFYIVVLYYVGRSLSLFGEYTYNYFHRINYCKHMHAKFQWSGSKYIYLLIRIICLVGWRGYGWRWSGDFHFREVLSFSLFFYGALKTEQNEVKGHGIMVTW